MGVGKYAALCKYMYMLIIGNQWTTQNNDKYYPETRNYIVCKAEKGNNSTHSTVQGLPSSHENVCEVWIAYLTKLKSAYTFSLLL